MIISLQKRKAECHSAPDSTSHLYGCGRVPVAAIIIAMPYASRCYMPVRASRRSDVLTNTRSTYLTLCTLSLPTIQSRTAATSQSHTTCGSTSMMVTAVSTEPAPASPAAILITSLRPVGSRYVLHSVRTSSTPNHVRTSSTSIHVSKLNTKSRQTTTRCRGDEVLGGFDL